MKGQFALAARLRGGGRPHSNDWFNAMCESFFATLECELLERRQSASQAEAKMACFSFIEGWYNPGSAALRVG
jgi:hypothetical protein